MGYKIDKDWLLKDSDKEDNISVSAGSFGFSMIRAVKTKTPKSRLQKPSRRGAPANIMTPRKKQAKQAS